MPTKPLSQTASAIWKRKNKAHVNEKLASWMVKNKDRRVNYMKRYNDSRKEKQREQDAARYLLPENAAKRAVLKEEKRIYMQKWHKANKGRHVASLNKRRARKKKAISGDLQLILKWEVSWRKQWRVRCYWCLNEFSPDDCQTDHVIPFKLDGKHSIENLCISCTRCNLSKHGKSLARWNQQIDQPVLF